MRKADLQPSDRKTQMKCLLHKVGFSSSDVYFDDNTKGNAYYDAFTKHIVLGTDLMEIKENELLGVLAHELGHWNGSHHVKLLAAFKVYSGLYYIQSPPGNLLFSYTNYALYWYP